MVWLQALYIKWRLAWKTKSCGDMAPQIELSQIGGLISETTS